MQVTAGNEIEAAPEVSRAIMVFLARSAPAGTAETFDQDTPLLGSGVLDSLSILQLMTFLSEELGIEVEDEDFSAENFATIDSLARFVVRKRQKTT